MEYNDVIPLYADKFFDHVSEKPEDKGCWKWTGYRDEDGYGHFQFRHDGKKYKIRAHRAICMIAGRRVPPQAVLRHSCDNRWCVNPDHIEFGTHADNVADCVAKGRNASGEDNGRSRLSDSAVLEVRKLAAAFVAEQSRKHGVDPAAIRSALSQRTWASDDRRSA